MRFYSFFALMVIFFIAYMAGFMFNNRNDKFYNYFHFTAGFLLTLFIYSFTNNYLASLLLTFVVGVIWEIYEWASWKYLLKKKKYKPTKKDTKTDLILDTLGGTLAIIVLYFSN